MENQKECEVNSFLGIFTVPGTLGEPLGNPRAYCVANDQECTLIQCDVSDGVFVLQ